MEKGWVFDQPHATRITEARQRLLRLVLPTLRRQAGSDTALDVGCGVGYFSTFLRAMGFRVVALDGRHENVEEARKRFPEIEFHAADMEDPKVQELGCFDLVLCVGLLYHLENPFQAIRNLYALTAKVALIESMCIPGIRPLVELREEGTSEDQGLNSLAFYPTESCLVKMLYRAGFQWVYRFTRLPDHEDFHATLFSKKVRTMLVASKMPLNSTFFCHVPEPMNLFNPWKTPWAKVTQPVCRFGSFLRKPWGAKLETLRRHVGWG